MMKRLAGLLLTLLLVLSAGLALAEMGRVQTPGGPVKMRKKDSAKSSLVTQIPNNTYLQVEEVGEEWCLVTYKGKTGYVKREYMVLASELAEVEPKLSLSPESPKIGDVIDFTVACEDAVSYQYTLTYVGSKPVKGKSEHAEVSYLARKAGSCCLEVTATLADGSTKTNQLFFEIGPEEAEDAAEAAAAGDDFILYSQKDGSWLNVRYRTSNLDVSGCAIFTLSHAMQLLGHHEEAVRPEKLAVTYAFCLVDGGTLNATLIGRAAKNLGFATKNDLIYSEADIIKRFEGGAVFTFSIVKGHIALAAGLSEDETKVLIIDSAPSATFERITNASLYTEDENGEWQAVEALTDIPGAKYYFETDNYGALTYYLDLKYVAKRGVRLIQPKE